MKAGSTGIETCEAMGLATVANTAAEAAGGCNCRRIGLDSRTSCRDCARAKWMMGPGGEGQAKFGKVKCRKGGDDD